MSAEPLSSDSPGFESDSAGAGDQDTRQRALRDALTAAERGLTEAAKAAERVIKDSMEALRAQTRAYSGPAAESFEEAQRYVVRRVKDRPVTATLAGLGVGFLLGILLSSRGK